MGSSLMASGNNKVATVIENQTGQGLTMKVGNPHCFVRLASVKSGGDYTVRLCVDWTYQEFVLEGKSDAAKKLYVNSDDCCDYERMTVKESHGVFFVETVARQQQPLGGSEVEVDAAAPPPSPPMKQKKVLRWRFWVKAW